MFSIITGTPSTEALAALGQLEEASEGVASAEREANALRDQAHWESRATRKMHEVLQQCARELGGCGAELRYLQTQVQQLAYS